MTPKQMVLIAEPEARADYSESKMGAGEPCWFIRRGYSGPWLMTGFASSPRAAWKKTLQQLVSPAENLAAAMKAK